jgi:hydrogenase small subunit
MADFTRREFLKMGGMLAGAAGLGLFGTRTFAAGLENIADGRVRVVWIEAMSCSGCSVSLLNTQRPGPVELLTQYVSMVYHGTIGAAQGKDAISTLEKAIEVGDFILVVEGAIPAGMPSACTIGGRSVNDWVYDLARSSRYVMSVGTCSSFGGIPGAEGNPTGAASVADYLESRGVASRGRVVNCPSCPSHPQSIVGTLAWLASGDYPEVAPDLLTPTMFYGRSTHDNCPRFHDYNKHIFAESFGDNAGCLFKLGCLGPQTFTECPNRQWNGGVNWCIRGGAPCIGCSSPDFARKRDFPFYRQNEELEVTLSGVGHNEDSES